MMEVKQLADQKWYVGWWYRDESRGIEEWNNAADFDTKESADDECERLNRTAGG